MNKKLIFAILSFVSIFCSIFSSIYFIEVAKADVPEDEWFTKQTIATASGLGYNDIRIVNVEVSSNGTIFLCFEARTGSDLDENDIYLYRSFDNGNTWVSEKWIEEISGGLSSSANCNPFFLQDDYRDRLYFFVTERKSSITTSTYMYWRYSDDNGATWSAWTDITSLKPAYCSNANGYAWNAQSGAVSDNGTVYIACSGKDSSGNHYPFVIRSWDGDTFHLAGATNNSNIAGGYNECSISICANGNLSLYARPPSNGVNMALLTSDDDGTTWTFVKGILSTAASKQHGRTYTKSPYTHRTLMAFTNTTGDRDEVSVIISYDGGYTWSYSKQIDSGTWCAYPAIAYTQNYSILCAYRERNGNRAIYLARFNLEWLTDSNDYISNNSGGQIITVDGVSSGSKIYDSTPTFVFYETANAIKYRLQIDNNNDFSSPEVDLNDINEYNYPVEYSESAIDSTVSFTIPDANELSKNYYYARVIAYS